MLRASIAPIALLACVVCVGCQGTPDHPPPAPLLDGSIDGTSCVPVCPVIPVDGGEPDLGADDAAIPHLTDGGGGTRGFCSAFPRAGSSVTQPAGFSPARIVARWNTESCAAPELIIALTEGGCDLIGGERFELRFNEAALSDGSITVGLNTLYDGLMSPLRMRYVNTAPPSTTVGPCALGTVNIDAATLTAGGRFSATFDLTLDDCSLEGDPGIALFGTIDVPIVESSSDACP